MFYHQHGQITQKSSSALQKRQQTTYRPAPQAIATHPAKLIQRAKLNPISLNTDDVLTLQETIGNRAASRMLAGQRATQVQAKLTIGEPGDKYEQEADRVASQVVKQLHTPATAESAQGQSVQRQDIDDEELQAKHEITALQRQDIDDDELQAKPSISHLQRVPLSPEVQREAMLEDDDLQAKSILQRQEGVAVGEASTDLESSINRARGSGQPLDAGLQQSMGQAMGADFSGVKVHTDAQSDQLNQSIQAKAFTTGQDMFFRQGEYNPGSRGGQELIAHELTHVVQQNGGTVMRKGEKGALASNGINKTNHIQRQPIGPTGEGYTAQRSGIAFCQHHLAFDEEGAEEATLRRDPNGRGQINTVLLHTEQDVIDQVYLADFTNDTEEGFEADQWLVWITADYMQMSTQIGSNGSVRINERNTTSVMGGNVLLKVYFRQTPQGPRIKITGVARVG